MNAPPFKVLFLGDNPDDVHQLKEHVGRLEAALEDKDRQLRLALEAQAAAAAGKAGE